MPVYYMPIQAEEDSSKLSCADHEGGMGEWGSDSPPHPGKSRHHRVASSVHQRNAMGMAFRWRAEDDRLEYFVLPPPLCKIGWLKQKIKT